MSKKWRTMQGDAFYTLLHKKSIYKKMLPYIIIHVSSLMAFFAWFYNWLTVGDAFYTLYKKCPKFLKMSKICPKFLKNCLIKLSI